MTGHLQEQIATYEQLQSELEAQLVTLRVRISKATQSGRLKEINENELSSIASLHRDLIDLLYNFDRVDTLLEDARMRAGLLPITMSAIARAKQLNSHRPDANIPRRA